MTTAGDVINKALEQFKSTLSPDDARTFSDTTYRDLWEGARAVEKELGRQKDLRFMRRIEPFLVSMKTYGPIIEVFAQGFSPMAFVWGPIKLMLHLAGQYSDVMEKILRAYAEISEVLPRMDRLKSAFGTTPAFQQVLALIFSDIIEFHKRSYKMFRRKAWHVWFMFDWGLFERRFKSIISRLASHCDSLDKEAASIHFLEMKDMREQRLHDEEVTEHYRQNQLMQDVFRWLSAAEDAQEEYLHHVSDGRLTGTCTFVFEDVHISPWIDGVAGPEVIWMNAIPGAGKSFTCSVVIQHLQTRKDQSTLYYFCGNKSMEGDSCGLILRTMANQLLRQNTDLAPLVHQAYLAKGSSKSSPAMKKLVKELLCSIKSTHIVVDGIDECQEAVQREILSSLTDIQSCVGHGCKILVSSRNEPLIKRALAKTCHVSLDGKTTASLHLYIDVQVRELQADLPDICSSLWARIEDNLKRKAQGMFLWVRLVTTMLKQQVSEADLEKAVDQLPDGLDEAYRRIIDRIRCLGSTENDRALRILFWVCTAYRPVNIYEVADAIVLKPGQTELNKTTRSLNVDRHILDICAPLLERSSRGIIGMVHFSAKEYLLDKHTGPFIDVAKAHFNAAFSCVVNLTTALVIIPRSSDGKPDSYFETMLIQGAYGLQQYAHCYWVQHTLAFLELKSYLDNEVLVLVEALERFSKVCKRREKFEMKHFQERSLDNAYKLPTSLQRLNAFPYVQNLIASWTHFQRKYHEVASSPDSLENMQEWQLAKDETFLSLIDQRLRKLRESLLRLRDSCLPSHIDPSDYKAFLERYYFNCHFYACESTFDSEADRDRHEASHVISYPCMQCDFSGRGFRTRKQLDRHTRTYHMSHEDFHVPPTIQAASIDRIASNGTTKFSRAQTRKASCWNDKGQRILKQTFEKVLSRVESEMTLLEPKDETSSVHAELTHSPDEPNLMSSSRFFDAVRLKIESWQFESMSEFKADVYQVLKDPQLLVISESFEDLETDLETICEQEVTSIASGYSDFICPRSDKLSTAKLLEDRQPTESAANDDVENRAQTMAKGPYWSVREVADFPGLVQLHGHDSRKIADVLMTKTPEDVEKHLKDLINSGLANLPQFDAKADATANQEEALECIRDFEIDITAHQSPATGTSSEDTLAVGDIPPSPPTDAPAAYVVGHDELLNYRPQQKPTGNTVRTPHHHQPQDDSTMSAQKRKRRPRRRALCIYCKSEFRDEFAVIKHVARLHATNRKVWVCKDVSPDKKFFGDCKACSKEKKYSAKHNALKHLRVAHFTADTEKEVLARWISELDEPNPNSDNKHSDAVAAKNRDRLPGPWESSKRRKIGSPDSYQDTDRNILPPMRDRPDFEDDESLGRSHSRSNSMSPRHEATPSKKVKIRDANAFADDQARSTNFSDLPSDVSFDNMIPGSPHETQNSVSGNLLSERALVRADHISRLPHLNNFQRATCLDQVNALYYILNHEDPESWAHVEALGKLRHLSQVLISDIRQWRKQNTFAPQIPFTI